MRHFLEAPRRGDELYDLTKDTRSAIRHTARVNLKAVDKLPSPDSMQHRAYVQEPEVSKYIREYRGTHLVLPRTIESRELTGYKDLRVTEAITERNKIQRLMTQLDSKGRVANVIFVPRMVVPKRLVGVTLEVPLFDSLSFAEWKGKLTVSAVTGTAYFNDHTNDTQPYGTRPMPDGRVRFESIDAMQESYVRTYANSVQLTRLVASALQNTFDISQDTHELDSVYGAWQDYAETCGVTRPQDDQPVAGLEQFSAQSLGE